MPILGQKYRHIDMSGLLIGHNRTAKVRIYLLIINIFRKKKLKKVEATNEKWRRLIASPLIVCGYIF